MSDETGAGKSIPEGEEDFLVCARRWYKDDYTADRDNIRNAGDDIRFYAGDQWLNEDRVQREAQNRPVITEDHLAPAVRQITNDMRMNKPAGKVHAVDSAADPETAKIFDGLIRNIERQSFTSSENAYVKGGENATICGRGAFRIITEYADDSGFDQDIKILPIRGALAVLWDSDAQSPTRDDARRCWILRWMSKEAFNAAYPDKPTTNWEGHSQVSQEWYRDWNRSDEILVAELFYKKPKKRTLWRMATDKRIVDVTDMDDAQRVELVEEEFRSAATQGEQIPNPPYEAREMDGSEVWRCVMNGGSILEPRRKWIGRYIPVINVLGEELFLDDSRTMRGLVRVGKDSQRMINYHNSAAIEHVSLSPKQPYLVTQQQIAGLETQWQIANRQNATYLAYKHDPNAPGPPSRLPAPQIPAALLTLKQEAVQGLHATTNVYPSATGADANEISGVAIQKRDVQGDVANFHYVDNLNKSIGYCYVQLVDLIPKVYDGQRVVRILGEDDAEEWVEINVRQSDGKIKNDLTRGKYDLAIVPGPSFSTKRAEAASFFEKFMQAASPQERANVMDLLVKNLDIAGADELYERLRKQAVANGIAEPDPERGEQPPQPQGPSPDEMIARAEMMKAEADLINAQTKAAQNQTSALKNAADARKSFAESEGQNIENADQMLELLMKTGALESAVGQLLAAALPGAIESALGRVVETQNMGVIPPVGPNGGV